MAPRAIPVCRPLVRAPQAAVGGPIGWKFSIRCFSCGARQVGGRGKRAARCAGPAQLTCLSAHAPRGAHKLPDAGLLHPFALCRVLANVSGFGRAVRRNSRPHGTAPGRRVLPPPSCARAPLSGAWTTQRRAWRRPALQRRGCCRCCCSCWRRKPVVPRRCTRSSRMAPRGASLVTALAPRSSQTGASCGGEPATARGQRLAAATHVRQPCPPAFHAPSLPLSSLPPPATTQAAVVGLYRRHPALCCPLDHTRALEQPQPPVSACM